MRTPLVLSILATLLTTAPVSADNRFDYERTQYLYVVNESGFVVYARFAGFHQFRNLISEKMRIADESISRADRTPPIYTLRLIGVHDQETLYVGDSWIGTDRATAVLNGDELKWIQKSVEARKGEVGDPANLEASIRRVVESQTDPAWEPAP